MDSNVSILLIEDDEILAKVTSETLRNAGFDCVACTTIAAANSEIRKLGAKAFDVVVADINLPDGDHTVLLATLKQLDVRCPVIIVTGTPTLDSSLNSLEHHVFAYLVKPVESARLLDSLARATGSGRLRRRLINAEQRYGALSAQIVALRGLTDFATAQRDIDESLADYASLLLSIAGEALAESMEVMQFVQSTRARTPLRSVSRHPEAEMLRDALEHTVGILEKTKSSFKSKELADLRHQLEAALAVSRPVR